MSIFEKYGAINSFTAIGDDNRLANSVNPDEPSHLDLHCLTFHPSTLHMNFFQIDSLIKKNNKKKKKKKKKQTTNVV